MHDNHSDSESNTDVISRDSTTRVGDRIARSFTVDRWLETSNLVVGRRWTKKHSHLLTAFGVEYSSNWKEIIGRVFDRRERGSRRPWRLVAFREKPRLDSPAARCRS